MNRDIKFRGKRIEDGQWIYGYLADEDYINNINEVAMPCEEVVKSSIGQFTGLYDKNGNEIYEGDVICVNPTKYGRGYVCWHDKLAQFIVNMLDRDQWYNIPNGVVEVCGNIYDNPEILKG